MQGNEEILLSKEKIHKLMNESDNLNWVQPILNEMLTDKTNSLKEKLAFCQQIEKKVKNFKNENLLGDVNFTRARLYRSVNQFPQALYYYTICLEHSKHRTQEEIANIQHQIGITNWYLGHYDNALEFFQNVFSTWMKEKNERSAANALCNIGTIYNRTKKYDDALRYFEESLEIREKIGDKKGIAISLNNIGIAYEHKHDFKKALSYHFRSFEIKKQLRDESGIATSLSNIGEIHYELNDMEKATDYCKNSLEIFQKLNEKWKLAYSYNLLGKIYLRNAQYSFAQKELDSALKIATKIKADDILKMTYETLSELFEKQNKLKDALHYFKLFSEAKDKIINENSAQKMMMLENKFEVERIEKEAAIYHLKNIELVEANQKVKSANEKLLHSNELLLKEIEEHKKADKKIQSHQEHLKLINKILRHDLTNNLSVTKSAINLMEKKNDLRFLEDMKKSIDKSISLIKKMREMEKLISENKNLKSFNISKVIDQVSANYPNIHITRMGNAFILADDTIFSVFDNLISNAVLHGKTDKVDISVLIQNTYVEIRIRDYGIGIPEHILDKIFDENFVYGKTGKSGIGLHIVKKSMESMSGGVFAENNEQQGSVFVLLFRNVTV